MTSVAFQVDQLMAKVPGGIGTYVRELVPSLAAMAPEMRLTLFHARTGRALPDGWASGLPVVPLPSGIRTLYPRWALTGLPPLPGSLRGLDVVHAPSPAAVPPAGPDQRLVVTVHDLAFLVEPRLFPPAWRTMYRLGLRRAVRQADALIAVSEHTARDLVERAGADADRIHVTPLAATLRLSAEDHRAELERLGVAEPYLLFVGTLEARKNLVRLVRAYRRVVARCDLPHALVLAGPPGWRSADLDRELATPAAGTVVRTGRVEPQVLDALYRGAAALAYPSLYEGFGLPVIEAMVRGIPVIASTSASLPEVAGDAALLASPHSVEDLAAAVERVLTDRAEAERLAEAGRARAAMFSWDRTARATVETYRSVL